MRTLLAIGLLTLVAFTGCQPKERAGTGAYDESFQKLADEYIQGYLAWRPLSGVYLGLHEYDGKITDYSQESLNAELARLKDFGEQLNSIDPSKLGKQLYNDYRILKSAIQYEIFSFEDLKDYQTNPMVYARAVDLNIYIKRDFAPVEDRIRSIIAIEEKVPAIYEAAKANLADSLPKPHTELAIDIVRGNASFLQNDLAIALKDVQNDSLMAAFREANEKAIAAMNGYADYLEKEKLPKAHNRYAIGAENYQKMLLYSEGITLSPQEILAIGLKELKKEQEVFNAAAKIINPGKLPIDVYKDVQKEHATAENLIPEARKHLEAIRQFLLDKKIVTMPSDVRVKVEETPPYARSTSTASMDTPGPFEEKATEAYYYITPVDPKWTPQEQEDWLTMFDYYTTDNVSVHEAYPGHYTQFLHLNASKATKLEKIFGSYAFIEGWAHYTEKMMIDEGWCNNGDKITAAKYQMAMSGDALLRICRLCVSVKTHTEGMTVDEATKFFMDNWYQGENPSKQEALRGTFDPGYLFYTVGKLQLLKLREDYKKQEGENFSLQKFHDAVLDNGMPPVYILREILLKDKESWNNTL